MFGPLKKHSAKRKPFVSTTKKVSTFGTPPPLPPVQRATSPERVSVAEDIPPPPDPPVYNKTRESSHEYALEPANYLKLQQKSVRWLNLSSALWSMIVVDANRLVDKKGVANILTAMMWRLHGEISEEEFTGLFLEWMGAGNFSSRKSQSKCGVLVLRNILLEQSIAEENLDVLLGMTIFEVNRRLLSSPLSFSVTDRVQEWNGSESPMGVRRKPTLEICSKRWLSLSEELFFMLDTPGFGYMGLDEFVFLGASLMVARREWASEAEAEQSFSVQTLAAVALHMMREAGATVNCSSSWSSTGMSSTSFNYMHMSGEDTFSRRHLRRSISSPVAYNYSGHRVRPSSLAAEGELLDDPDTPFIGSAEGPGFPLPPPNMSPPPSPSRRPQPPLDTGPWVSLPMFKLFLMKQGLGEGALLSLITLIRECSELVANLSAEKGVDVLYRACKAYGGGASGGHMGPPKMWHSCVYGVSGYPPPDVEERQGMHLPPVLLYLLSDAQKLTPGAWVAAQPADALEVDAEFRDAYGTVRSRDDLESEEDMLIHYASYALWTAFCNWGDEESRNAPAELNAGAARKDSAYQFIMSVLAEYKASLMLLCAAFVDIAMDHFSGGIAVVGAGRNSAAGIAAASLLPTPAKCVGILREMFPNTSHMVYALRKGDKHDQEEVGQMEPLNDDRYPFSDDSEHVSVIQGGKDPTFGGEYGREDRTDIPQVTDTPQTNHIDHHFAKDKQEESINSDVGKGSPPVVSTSVLLVENCVDSDLAAWIQAAGNEGSGDSESKPAAWNATVLSDIQNAIWATVFDTQGSTFSEHTSPDGTSTGAARTVQSGYQRKDGTDETTAHPQSASPGKTASESSSLNFSERRRARRRKQGVMSSRFRRRERAPLETIDVDDESVLLDELMYCEEVDKDAIIDQLREIRQKKALDKLYDKQQSRMNGIDDSPDVGLSTHREGRSDADVSSVEDSTRRGVRTGTRLGDRSGRGEKRTSAVISPVVVAQTGMDEQQDLNADAVSSLRAAVEAMEAIKRSQEKVKAHSLSDPDASVENDTSRGNSARETPTSQGKRSPTKHCDKEDTEQRDSPASKAALSEASSLAGSVIEMLEKGQTAGLYAQSLRDLLRKMSRDDADMQLKSLEKIIELGNSIMRNEEQRQSVDRQRPRHSTTPPTKLQQRAGAKEPQNPNTMPPGSTPNSGEKPPWSTLVKRYNPPTVRPPYDPYEARSRDSGAVLLGAKTPSSRGSTADSGHSWREETNSSLLGNDTVRVANTAKRIPGVEPKGKRKHIDKPFAR